MYDGLTSIKVRATERTPLLEYIPKEMTFNMKGVSIPENAKEFYDPILLWIENFVSTDNTNPLIINIDLDYFSIQSASILLRIIKLFDKLPDVTVNWFYEDTDIEEIGHDLSSMVKMKFNHINKNPDYYNKFEV